MNLINTTTDILNNINGPPGAYNNNNNNNKRKLQYRATFIKARTDFEGLSRKMKERIFSFLPFEEKKNCRQVSKTWTRIIDRSLHFNIPPLSDATLPWIVNCRQKIRQLTVQDFTRPTPMNMIFLKASTVREVTILNSHDSHPSQENLTWLLHQCESVVSVEVNSIPPPPKPEPPPPKIPWTTSALNFLWLMLLYLVKLTNRVLLVMRACPIIVERAGEDEDDTVESVEEPEDWEPYKKGVLDCFVLGLTLVQNLTINCTHWSIVNLTALRCVKALSLHNPDAALLEEIEKHIMRNVDYNHFQQVEGMIITGSRGAAVRPSTYRAMMHLPKIYMIVLEKIVLDRLEEYKEIVQYSDRFSQIIERAYLSLTDNSNAVSTFWITIANGEDLLELMLMTFAFL